MIDQHQIIYALLSEMRQDHSELGEIVILHTEDRKRLANKMGLSRNSFNSAFHKLVEKKKIKKVSSGVYKFLK